MSELKTIFDKSRQLPSGETLEQLRQNYFIEAQMRGSDEQSIGGLNINTSGRQNSALTEEKKRGQASQDAIFYALLNDMRQRLTDLESSMTERYNTLQQKYGDDVVGGMVDTFLSDEEKAGLETEEEKMQALADKFLNEDGTIKDEYKDSEEAKYVKDWQEAEKLRPIVAKYEGRNDLTIEEKREVYSTAENTSLASNSNMIVLSSNDDFKATVNQEIDQTRNTNAQIDTSTDYGFN